MDNHKLYFSLVAGLALIIPAGCTTVRTPQRSKPAAKMRPIEAPGYLTLAVEPSKARYVLAEPVYVTLRLKNGGKEALRAVPNLDPEFGSVSLSISAGDNKAFRFVPLAMQDSDAPPQSLAPGTESAEVVPIFYGGRGWTFKNPGQYTVTAAVPVTVQGQTQAMVRSKPVTITVETGKPVEAGKLLMEGSQGDEVGKFLTWNSGDHLRRGIGRMTEVAERFPDSPLRDYIAFAFARNLSRPFKDYSIPRLRPADCEGAAKHFKRVRAGALPPVLEIQMHLAQARCARVTKDPESLRSALVAAKRLIAAKPEFQKLGEQAKAIENERE